MAVAGMGTAFAGAACPPKEQLSASPSCEDAGGVVIRIANSSDQDVNFVVTSKDHPHSHYTGTALHTRDGHKVRVTDVDLPNADRGDVWKVSYDNDARSDYVKIKDSCPAPKPSESAPAVSDSTSPTTVPVVAASQPALAHTGADNTPVLAGGAAVLLVAGAGTVLFTRRMRRNH
jgi:LPXTG-motif cell wall-anchored protein